jgi:serine/threonine protein kinase
MDPADDVSGRPASSEPDYRPATLARRLEHGPLTTAECLASARQLLSGLAHLHAAGMVHRDVKPSNCLFVGRELKLADFGLLTRADLPASRQGTVKYMPPDGHMDARADVYAAGLVIYELVTGLPAESFPRLGCRAREIAADPTLGHLNRLALRACQPEPERRFGDACEMLAELESGPLPRRPGWRRALVAAVALAAVVSAVAVASLFFRPTPPQQVDVNFITEPYEATIYLDGELLVAPDGAPYRTPCTVGNLPAGTHAVAFKQADLPDLDAGRIDLGDVREVIARWPQEDAQPE